MLDIEAVAERLGISISTVRALVRKGELPAYKVGGQLRFEKDDIEAYLTARRVVPKIAQVEN
jgi:excisionase family DNA binding protein